MRLIFAALIVIAVLSCSKNILDSASRHGYDDDDYYDQALAALNEQSYDETLSIITTKMSVSGQALAKTRELVASAYAGKCGMNFIDYTDGLASATSPSILGRISHPFVGVNPDLLMCYNSLQTMDLIGPPSARTDNQNLFVSVIGMVLAGAATRLASDISPQNGDGVKDVDVCTGVSNNHIDAVIIGVGYMIKNASSLRPEIVGTGTVVAVNNIASMCQSLNGNTSCDFTNPSQITPTHRTLFRNLMNTTEFGVGSVVTGGSQAAILTACP